MNNNYKEKNGFAKHIILKYYKKYKYIYSAKPSLKIQAKAPRKVNDKVKKFKRIRLVFLLFNMVTSIAMIIVAFALL